MLISLRLKSFERARRGTDGKNRIHQNVDLRGRNENILYLPRIKRREHRHIIEIERSADGNEKNARVRFKQRNGFYLFQEIEVKPVREIVVDIEHVDFGVSHVVELAERGKSLHLGGIVLDLHVLLYGHVKTFAIGKRNVALLLFDYLFIDVILNYLVIYIHIIPFDAITSPLS